MKVVIFAGGFGARFSEESDKLPKPMIEIGGMPILWHILKIYSSYGFNEFVICAGYKQHIIKDWFSDYFLHTSDITFDFALRKENMTVHNKRTEPWKITIVDTGLNTQTGGRLRKVRKYIGEETFMLTYGDGVADIDISKILEFHKKHGKICTVSMHNFCQNKGIVEVGKNGLVNVFRSKSDSEIELINIGFMVIEPKVFDYIDDDMTLFEQEPMSNLAKEKELAGYVHRGYWQCIDTNRDRIQIEELWESGKAPWKKWDD